MRRKFLPNALFGHCQDILEVMSLGAHKHCPHTGIGGIGVKGHLMDAKDFFFLILLLQNLQHAQLTLYRLRMDFDKLKKSCKIRRL